MCTVNYKQITKIAKNLDSAQFKGMRLLNAYLQ